jgi:polysaccharide pyruvyl transferase WcaK-like protein
MIQLLRRRNQISRKRYLVSTAGLPNFGDEFITRTWLRYLAEKEPHGEVWLDCSNPGHAALLFNGIHPHLHIVNTLWQLVWNSSHLLEDLPKATELIRHWITEKGTPREDLGIDLLTKMDSIHFLGGGYVNDLWKANLLLFTAADSVKKQNPSLTLFTTGLGLSPLSGENLTLFRESLTNFQYVGVRDSESAKAAQTSIGFDDAFLALSQENYTWNTQYPRSRAFICLQQDVIGKYENSVSTILSSLRDSGVDEDETLTLVEAIPPDDSWSLPSFQEQWPGEVELLPFTYLWNIGFPTGEDVIWASSRFHMHLLGAASGARGINLQSGNSYYQNKHASLLRLGTGWNTLSLQESEKKVAAKTTDFAAKAATISSEKKREADFLYRS